jgi:hypothetical protein
MEVAAADVSEGQYCSAGSPDHLEHAQRPEDSGNSDGDRDD